MAHPVLLVGVGGSGLNTLAETHRLIAANFAMRSRMANEVFYLAVDTERSALDGFRSSVERNAALAGENPPVVVTVPLSHGIECLHEIVHPAFEEPFFGKPDDPGLARLRDHWWFDPDGKPFSAPRVRNITYGAGQCPQVAYGLAWYRLCAIEDAVRHVVNGILKRNHDASSPLENMEVFIVAGLSGGTGRGCWNLIAFKIRECLLDNYGITVSPIGIFFDGSVFDSIARDNPEQRLAIELNSSIGLSELSCWMRNRTSRPEEQFEYRLPDMNFPGSREKDVLKVDLELDPNSSAPVSRAYLICGRSKAAILDNSRQYHEMAGSAIFAMIANPEISGRSVNDVNAYNSLGACRFEVDALHIRAYCEARARGMVLGDLAAGADDMSAPASSFFADHPLDAVALTEADLRPNAEGTLYQRTVAALLSGRTYKSAFATLVEELGAMTLSNAEDAILPLLQPATDAEVEAAVQQALKGFGKKGNEDIHLGLDGNKGEAAVMAAMKEVCFGDAVQTPSIGRALEFLKVLKARIECARSIAPSVLQISTPGTIKATDPTDAVMTTLHVYSKRTFMERLKGVGSFNEAEVYELVHPEGNGCYWGIVPQGVAVANYPKIKVAIDEAFSSTFDKIEKLIAVCEQFVNGCWMARAAFALEEPIAAGGKIGDDAFSKLFSTPDKVEETLYDRNDRTCLYRRILRPIVESREEVDAMVRTSIHVGKSMEEFVARAVVDGSPECFDRDSGAYKRFIGDLVEATRSSVSLSTNFLANHFTFEKVLERNRGYWNGAIEAAQDSACRSELFSKFLKTLGVEPRINPRNLMMPPGLPEIDELRLSIASSLASMCAPWWITETTGGHHSVMLFVPFDISRVKTEPCEYIAKKAPYLEVQTIGLNDSKGGVTPFGYVAFASEGIGLSMAENEQGTHLLDKIRSLDYWDCSDVRDCLRLAERPDGKSLFVPEGMRRPFGYVSPWFVRNPAVSAMRWKPWAEGIEFPPASRKQEVLPVEESPRPDVFISNRRATGLETARTLQFALKAHGYSVFFDYDSLQDGVFNRAIFKAIENCKVVVALLSDGSLDRCVNKDDWVRQELEHAFRAEKKIVPVAASDVFNHWKWPRSFPNSLAGLKEIQISELHMGSFFNHSVDEIIAKRFGFRPGQV